MKSSEVQGASLPWPPPGLHHAGTILEGCFGRQSPTHESKLPMQLGCTGSCEPSGWVQMHNLGRVHWVNAGNHNVLSVFKVS